MSSVSPFPQIASGDHNSYMTYALSLAKLSSPKPTNFCVGAILVDTDRNTVLATGYTGELEGNTHAEQCCFIKLAKGYGVREEDLGPRLPPNTVLYTTMEPCNQRSVGNMTCVERILRYRDGIKVMYVGVAEPEKFVGQNVGRSRLVEAGIRYEVVEGLEKEILEVATAGHIDR